MNRLNATRLLAASVLLLALACPGTTQPDKPAEVSLKPVKYTELGKLVRAQKGKVVLVDFWGLT